jgi:TRAP-type C4-dicarboxylate transport system permease large subunit
MDRLKKMAGGIFGIAMMLSCVWLAKMMVWDYPKSEKPMLDFLCSAPWSFVLMMVIIFGIIGSVRNDD